MSRRETFLESARAENERLLTSAAAEAEAESKASLGLSRELEADLREMKDGVLRLEELLSETTRQPGRFSRLRIDRFVLWKASTWILVGALLAFLVIAVLKPDWALRPDQRADLLLGQRMSEILRSMDEVERSEVLNTLWQGSPPPTVPTD